MSKTKIDRNLEILDFTCNICSTSYVTEKEFIEHCSTPDHLICLQNYKRTFTNLNHHFTFTCYSCSYTTHKRQTFMKHLQSHKHQEQVLDTAHMVRYGNFYVCKSCCKRFGDQSNYNKHLKTQKHLNTSRSKKLPVSNIPSSELSKYVCECGKEYSYKKAFLSHLHDCRNTRTQPHAENYYKNIVDTLVTQNEKLQKQLIEMAKEPKIVHNTTNNMHNTSNTTINMMSFLNNECKNAMNFKDFIENLHIDFNQLEGISKYGYLHGIQESFIKGIKDLKTSERPIHCTDTKRFTFYLKDNDSWNKHTDTSNIDNALSKLVNKQFNCLQQWKIDNPDWNENPSKYDKYVDIMSEIMKGDNEKDGSKYKKKAHRLIGNVCKLKIEDDSKLIIPSK